jgi:hypothetical protein
MLQGCIFRNYQSKIHRQGFQPNIGGRLWIQRKPVMMDMGIQSLGKSKHRMRSELYSDAGINVELSMHGFKWRLFFPL